VIADISFEQAVFGDEIDVSLKLPTRCGDCDGSGAGEGTRPVTCSDCGGSGQVQRIRQSLLGQMVTASPCSRCGGLGQIVTTPCATCRGEGRVTSDKSYQVDVPAGVDSGSTLRLSGRGAVGPRGGGSGDLYVHLRVAPHERFVREDHDLVTEVPISIAQAALGTEIDLETLDGTEHLVVPAGTQPGREFVLRQRGVPTPARSWSWRPARPGPRRHPHQADRRRGRPAHPLRRRARRGRRQRQGRPVLADQVGVLLKAAVRWDGSLMDRAALRSTSAHVLVDPICSSTTERSRSTTTPSITCARCFACAPANRSASPMVRAAGAWPSRFSMGTRCDWRPRRRSSPSRRRQSTDRDRCGDPEGRPARLDGAEGDGTGVDRLVLLHADHSVVRWKPDRVERNLARLQRIADEALRQSRRVVRLTIDAPTPAVDALGAYVLAEPGGRTLTSATPRWRSGPRGMERGRTAPAVTGSISVPPSCARRPPRWPFPHSA
jgi:hypothetical protein